MYAPRGGRGYHRGRWDPRPWDTSDDETEARMSEEKASRRGAKRSETVERDGYHIPTQSVRHGGHLSAAMRSVADEEERGYGDDGHVAPRISSLSTLRGAESRSRLGRHTRTTERIRSPYRATAEESERGERNGGARRGSIAHREERRGYDARRDHSQRSGGEDAGGGNGLPGEVLDGFREIRKALDSTARRLDRLSAAFLGGPADASSKGYIREGDDGDDDEDDDRVRHRGRRRTDKGKRWRSRNSPVGGDGGEREIRRPRGDPDSVPQSRASGTKPSAYPRRSRGAERQGSRPDNVGAWSRPAASGAAVCADARCKERDMALKLLGEAVRECREATLDFYGVVLDNPMGYTELYPHLPDLEPPDRRRSVRKVPCGTWLKLSYPMEEAMDFRGRRCKWVRTVTIDENSADVSHWWALSYDVAARTRYVGRFTFFPPGPSSPSPTSRSPEGCFPSYAPPPATDTSAPSFDATRPHGTRSTLGSEDGPAGFEDRPRRSHRDEGSGVSHSRGGYRPISEGRPNGGRVFLPGDRSKVESESAPRPEGRTRMSECGGGGEGAHNRDDRSRGTPARDARRGMPPGWEKNGRGHDPPKAHDRDGARRPSEKKERRESREDRQKLRESRHQAEEQEEEKEEDDEEGDEVNDGAYGREHGKDGAEERQVERSQRGDTGLSHRKQHGKEALDAGGSTQDDIETERKRRDKKSRKGHRREDRRSRRHEQRRSDTRNDVLMSECFMKASGDSASHRRSHHAYGEVGITEQAVGSSDHFVRRHRISPGSAVPPKGQESREAMHLVGAAWQSGSGEGAPRHETPIPMAPGAIPSAPPPLVDGSQGSADWSEGARGWDDNGGGGAGVATGSHREFGGGGFVRDSNRRGTVASSGIVARGISACRRMPSTTVDDDDRENGSLPAMNECDSDATTDGEEQEDGPAGFRDPFEYDGGGGSALV